MGPTLEAFVKKNGLRMVFTQTIIKEVETSWGAKTEGRRSRKTQYRYQVLPPVMLRHFRVYKKDDISVLSPSYCDTPKQAREDLLRRIRGGVLKYDNGLDPQGRKDQAIRVPKNIR